MIKNDYDCHHRSSNATPHSLIFNHIDGIFIHTDSILQCIFDITIYLRFLTTKLNKKNKYFVFFKKNLIIITIQFTFWRGTKSSIFPRVIGPSFFWSVFVDTIKIKSINLKIYILKKRLPHWQQDQDWREDDQNKLLSSPLNQNYLHDTNRARVMRSIDKMNITISTTYLGASTYATHPIAWSHHREEKSFNVAVQRHHCQRHFALLRRRPHQIPTRMCQRWMNGTRHIAVMWCVRARCLSA